MDIIQEAYSILKIKDILTTQERLCYLSLIVLLKRCEFSEVICDIINDVFMGRVNVDDENNTHVRLNERLLSSTKLWFCLCEHLCSQPEIKKLYLSLKFFVYRGIHGYKSKDRQSILQPLPFSCCVEFDNAKNWIVPDRDDSFIIEIELDNEINNYTFTGNLEEGNEIVLPPGRMYYISERYDRVLKTKILRYKLQATSTYEEFIEMLRSESNLVIYM